MSESETAKRHMNLMTVILFVACLLLVGDNSVFAVPYLQLDAHPSDYVSGDEQSIVTTDQQFTLYALVESTKGSTSADFYISVAIIPDPGSPPTYPDLGSYEFDGKIFNVTQGGADYNPMEYGVPPLETHMASMSLPGHGIFDTYYREHSITLDTTNPLLRADPYDAQVDFGGPDPDHLNPFGDLYFQAISVDASGLLYPPYRLHFDFYTKDGDGGIVAFAPFSHDVVATPIPASVILGILGLGVVGLKLRKFA